jgi:hypothetical protein
MKCEDTKLLLVDFLYEEIEPEAEKLLRLHLDSCSACRGEYEGLQRTSLALRAWPEAEPPHALVFVEKRASWWAALQQVLFPEQASVGVRLGFGLAVAAVTALLLSAVLNLEFKYDSAGFAYRTSLAPRANVELTEEVKRQLLAELQKQNSELVAQMVQAGYEKQRSDLDRTLFNLTSEWQRQRQNDLIVVGRGLEEVQQSTDTRLRQTHQILDQLMRVSGPVQK